MNERRPIEPETELIDEESTVTVIELCRSCGIESEVVETLVAEGILEPEDPRAERPRFSATSLRRTRITVRLQRDLGVNLAGAAVALELLDQIEELRARLRALGG
jgi:chaperone modulatory protein CbpM